VEDFANKVRVQVDGKIVAAGYCSMGSAGTRRFCLARLDSIGNFDPDFDGPASVSPGNGRFMLPSLTGTTTNEAYALAIQPDGAIVVGGFCTNASPVLCVVRLNADGSFDATFDGPGGSGDGMVLLPLGTSGNSSVNSIAIQPDGKLVLAGSCTVAGSRDFCVARLHSDGTLDTGFDGESGSANGAFSFAMGIADDRAAEVALQPDGRMLVAGTCGLSGKQDFCIARLNGGSYGAMRCTLDLDGDNYVIASIDGLIMTRVALGMVGSAALAGVSFPAGAIRTDWSSIRTYLVTQCGMTIAP
jgi:uncharacterized delta-60 repeat protein